MIGRQPRVGPFEGKRPAFEESELVLKFYHSGLRDRIGRDRGWPPATREQYDAEAANGALMVGSPESVAPRIARTIQALSASRFDLKYSNGTMPHEQLMTAIDLYGTEVVPRVKALLES